MNCHVKSFLGSSIGKKYLMGIVGLLLCGFLLAHLAGNITLLISSDLFNLYAYNLTKNKPILYVMETGLAGLFLCHIGLGIKLTMENYNARPDRYYMQVRTGRGATLASKTMPITGLIILVFIILHLLQLKFGTVYTTTVDGVEMRDLYKTVMEYFANPLNTVWYVFAMLTMGFHLIHGFQSAFQSVGFNHPKYNKWVRCLGMCFSALVGLGFSALAICCHLKGA